MASKSARVVRTLARLTRVLECSLQDLTLPQYRVLAAVDDGGDRATHLAHGLALAKPTVTAAVDGLVDRGLLSREAVPGDRRSVRIVLTGAGRLALREAEAAMAAALTGVLDRAQAGETVLDAITAIEPALEPSRGAGRR